MISSIRDWYNRHFSDPQVVLLALLLIFGFAAMMIAGKVLAPLIAAIVIAYLLDGGVMRLSRLGVPYVLSVSIVFLVFMAIVLAVLIWLLPLLIKQTGQFFAEVPNMLNRGQQLLLQLPERYPNVVTEEDVVSVITQLRGELGSIGQAVVSISVSSVMNVITVLVYLVLVPVLIFFLLKDKYKLFSWASSFLPTDRRLAMVVWKEMNAKIAGYSRGKLAEILIVWAVSYVTFLFLDLDYALLLSFLVGVSVIVPYVGAFLVTIPIALIAFFQWGVSRELAYVLAAYTVIQFLDGNVLVPLLFSEMVNLHPIAIIAAVLVFGNLWGLWGVFFAIPLATLVQVVMNAWPRRDDDQGDHDEGLDSHEAV